MPNRSNLTSRRDGGARDASQRIPRARPTPLGLLLCAAYLGLPVGLVGGALDLALQWLTGHCVGLWCLA